MTPLVIARVALLVAGIILFVMSIRTGHDTYRYVAIGLLAVAIILRFVDRAMTKRDR
jgi:hypothetical protein